MVAVMAKKKSQELVTKTGLAIDEITLFERVSAIIENRKDRAGAYANREITLMYWEVGEHIRENVLDGNRAAYGKRIVAELALQLMEKYGSTFDVTNIRRMMRFAEKFPAFESKDEEVDE
jgi:hypothetical protein